jgi:hypothetical protein
VITAHGADHLLVLHHHSLGEDDPGVIAGKQGVNDGLIAVGVFGGDRSDGAEEGTDASAEEVARGERPGVESGVLPDDVRQKHGFQAGEVIDDEDDRHVGLDHVEVVHADVRADDLRQKVEDRLSGSDGERRHSTTLHGAGRADGPVET